MPAIIVFTNGKSREVAESAHQVASRLQDAVGLPVLFNAQPGHALYVNPATVAFFEDTVPLEHRDCTAPFRASTPSWDCRPTAA